MDSAHASRSEGPQIDSHLRPTNQFSLQFKYILYSAIMQWIWHKERNIKIKCENKFFFENFSFWKWSRWQHMYFSKYLGKYFSEVWIETSKPRKKNFWGLVIFLKIWNLGKIWFRGRGSAKKPLQKSVKSSQISSYCRGFSV